MSVFEYKALNAKGKNRSGIIDAYSESAARQKLRQQTLFSVSLSRIDEDRSAKEKGGKKLELPGLFSRIKSADIAMITRLLSTLLSAGFPLVKAVAVVRDQIRSGALHRVLSRVKDSIEQGSSFAEALSLYPGVFSSVYINMVAAGESSGTLEIVLERLADFSEKREVTQKKIWASLAYPIIMAMIGFLVLVILMTYIVPGIVEIFSDMNQTLPLSTRILIAVSEFFTSFWWAILLFPVLVAGGSFGVRKTKKGLLTTDRMLVSLPIVGNLVRKLAVARFLRTLGSLLENGMPMLTALRITQNVAGNQVISNLIRDVADRVEKGGELGKALSGTQYFPSLAVQMIQVGEKSGEMEKMLEKSADLYEKDVHSAVTAATALIETLIILLMGLAVGLIIMAICLPIVEINQSVV
ncbi:MAG: type II secretion system inner membrane protein GspF [Desulfobacter sp.]|nr:type II secretion system inner membrane protein GspF [Desulfobacter sp.]